MSRCKDTDLKEPTRDPKHEAPVLPNENDWTPRRSTPVPPPTQPKALVRRPAQPTMTDLTSPPSVSGGTLRPPGAVPPPPRSIPRSISDEAEGSDPQAHDSSPARSVGLPAWGHSHRPSSHQRRTASVSGLNAANGARDAKSPPSARAEMAPRSDAVPPATEQGALGEAGRLRPPRLRRVWLTGTLAFATVAAAIGWLALRRPRPQSPARTVVPHEASLHPKLAVACTPAGVPRRIASTLLMTVPPVASETLVDGRMLVGFAENPTTAVGIAVDPQDLDISIPYREQTDQRVVSVTPYDQGGKPRFFDWREHDELRRGRLVGATPDFAFGLSDAGFARQPVGGSVEAVWQVDAKANVTDPRIASVRGRGHAVTFRHGGQSGNILLGWLSASGQAVSSPSPIDATPTALGTPCIAANATSALVGFAGRAGETGSWSLWLSLAHYGQPPAAAVSFQLPQGGPGGDAIAPALTSVAENRWLLQWSEGLPGQRQVRVQTLDELGRPLGLAHTVSPVGSNSGQGLLWSANGRAVSLFMVSTGKSAELWAAPITCPE